MEEWMGHMKDNIESIVNLLQNTKENNLKGDDAIQGAHDDKNRSHVEKPSINKHAPKEFDSNARSNQGWSKMGIQLPKVDMRKFDGKESITWIF
jgi:hypothetical protein